MITLRKLRSLPRKTRLRKILSLLEQWSSASRREPLPDAVYGRGLMETLAGDEQLPELLREAARRLAGGWHPDAAGDERFLRDLEHLRFGLMEQLGAAPADWDFYDPEGGGMSRKEARIRPLRVYLDDVRSPFNVGSIFRTAEAFGAEQLYLSPYTADPGHKRARRTSMGCVDILPWQRRELDELEELPFFALEVGGVPVEEFSFPPRGIAAVGSEELGISPETRARARESRGLVSIGTGGAKGSLNVSVAFGILMHRWVSSLTAQGSGDSPSRGES